MLVLRPSDLRLVPPAAVIRSLDDPACGCRRSRAPPPRDRSSASSPSPPSSRTEAPPRRGSPVAAARPLRARRHRAAALPRTRDDRPRAARRPVDAVRHRGAAGDLGADRGADRRHRPRPDRASRGRRRRSRCRFATPRRARPSARSATRGSPSSSPATTTPWRPRSAATSWPPASCAIPRDLRPEVDRRRRRPSGWTPTRSGPARPPGFEPGPGAFSHAGQPTKTWRSKPHDRRPDRRRLR